MINIGNFNKLTVDRRTDFGYYLYAGTGNSKDDILLPNKNALNKELIIGDEIEAFIYRDSNDRVVATLNKPLAVVGDLAYLKVVSTTKIGSFIDFGLERDILVPLKEKLYGLQEGKYYLFYIYLDKTGRIAATTDVDRFMDTTDQYKIGDKVNGTVYGFQTNKTVMLAVDNLYRAVVLNNEYFNVIHHGDKLEGTIIKVYEDGRLGLSLRKTAKDEIKSLQEIILIYLKEHNGYMPFNDKSSPESIHETFNTSKNYFKQALGGLMKNNLISQDDNGSYLKK